MIEVDVENGTDIENLVSILAIEMEISYINETELINQRSMYGGEFMKKNYGKRIVRMIPCTLLLTIVLLLLHSWRYIDVSVIMTIYLPIWMASMIAALLGKVIIANITILSAGLGLIAEYLAHLTSNNHPNMSGAFLNTLILFMGIIVGVVLEILRTWKIKGSV